MNKAELIDAMASDADISKSQAAAALDGALSAIGTTLAAGGKVTLVGFGAFSVSDRAARTGRNPRTGEAIQIPARKVPKFKAGKALSDQVQG